MRIDREAVVGSLLLGLLLLAPVALGVLIVHLGIMPRWDESWHRALLVTVGVLWIYGMIEARSKRGWAEVVLVALSLPLFYVALLASPLASVGSGMFAITFLPWLFALSLLSAHLYGRRIHAAMGACLVVTAFLTVIWYEATVYPALRWWFQWQS